MSATVRIHRLASKEALAAYRRYYRTSPAVANDFRSAVSQAAKKIADAPKSWPVIVDEFRWVRTRRFPYLLIFKIINSFLVGIAAVAHVRRRPGYWRRRKM